jgi:hypothetical protein
MTVVCSAASEAGQRLSERHRDGDRRGGPGMQPEAASWGWQGLLTVGEPPGSAPASAHWQWTLSDPSPRPSPEPAASASASANLALEVSSPAPSLPAAKEPGHTVAACQCQRQRSCTVTSWPELVKMRAPGAHKR